MSERQTAVRHIEGWGVLLGYIEFGDTWDGATHSRGRWTITDADGRHLRDVPDAEDAPRDGVTFRRTAATERHVLAIARTVLPDATHLGDTEVMANTGVIDAEGGYAILRTE